MTIEEALAASEAEPVTDDDMQFWIDEHLRVISIPKNGVVAGVEGDKNVNKIKFGMNRYYHGFDMSELSGRILYSNAKGNKNYYNITDMQTNGNIITFSWLVDADAVQYMGKTAFVVYLFKTQGSELRQKFYSTLATLNVLEGMEVDSAVPVEKQTDIIERMKEEISAYAEEVKKSLPADYTAMTEQVSSLKEDLSKLSEKIDDLKENGINTGNGATTTQANSLWTVLQKIAFAEALTDEELDTFKTAWKISNSDGTDPEATLSSISATYTGGDVAIGTVLTNLTGIIVTATYSDGSTATVTGYTLSGEIAEGKNTITVSYGGKTTTFTVTGVAKDTPEPLHGTYWPPKGAVTDWSNHTWDGVENFAYTGNTGIYIDGGFSKAEFIRLDKLQGTLYIRTLTNNQYGTLQNAYKVYANSDGELSTGGFKEVVPTITRNLGTMIVNDVTYYFVLFKFEIPSGQTGYFTSAQNSANSGYFISDDKIAINEEYKPYYTLFTSNPTDRITEPATEVN